MTTPNEKKQKQKLNKKNKKVKWELLENVEKLKNTEEDTKNIRLLGKKKRIREKDNNVQGGDAIQLTNTTAVSEPTKVGVETTKENKLSRKKKRKTDDLTTSPSRPEAAVEEKKGKSKRSGKNLSKKTEKAPESNGDIEAEDVCLIVGKSKRSGKNLSKKTEKAPESNGDVEAEDVYHISSIDGDFSKGMKKWIMEYHQKRPGLKVLQQRIDNFITAHEEKLEQEREEKLANAAEGGWTVVVHHKGRKKTTDAESGIAVGSVAQAAVKDKMAKKKTKEVGLDFYRFQKREAQKNEIMMLRSKFEEDKKRIQQQRAERKFRPY